MIVSGLWRSPFFSAKEKVRVHRENEMDVAELRNHKKAKSEEREFKKQRECFKSEKLVPTASARANK